MWAPESEEKGHLLPKGNATRPGNPRKWGRTVKEEGSRMKTLRTITVLMHVGAVALVLVMMHRDRVAWSSLALGDALPGSSTFLAGR